MGDTGEIGDIESNPADRLAPSSSATVRRAPRRRALAGLGAVTAVMLIAVLAAGLLATHNAEAPQPILSELTINLAKDNLYCATNLVWSPDGTRIAFVAYKDGCLGQFPMVAVYDARTGRQVRTVDLAPLLAQFGTAGGPVFWVSWSPDGQTLVVPTEIAPQHMSVGPSGALIPSTSPWVLLLVPAQGGAAHHILSTDLEMQQGYDRTIWDVAGGGVAGILDRPLPQALSYRWTGDGHLVADAPLPASSSPGTFSGSPTSRVGAGSISRWHSGAMYPSYLPGPKLVIYP